MPPEAPGATRRQDVETPSGQEAGEPPPSPEEVLPLAVAGRRQTTAEPPGLATVADLRDLLADVGPPPAALGTSTIEEALGNRYRVEFELGAGGMGRVYRATDQVLDRPVALKTVHPEILADPQWLARFRVEAAVAAGLQHPNIVQVHEILDIGSTPVLVMELVEGSDLTHRVEAQAPSPREAARLLAEVCEALEYAHGHGVIHRDIKPGNILLGPDGIPKLTDFGLAVRPDRMPAGSMEAEGVVGTPAYMAPEQARGEARAITNRSDVYALGATLYFALTGQPPFRGSTFSGVIGQVLRADPAPPSSLRTSVDRDLEAICLKAMQKDPDRRYGSAREMARDLRNFLGGRPVTARRYGPLEAVGRALLAGKTAFALGLLAVALLLGGVNAAVHLLYTQATADVFEELRRKVRDLASTAVLLVDPAQVQVLSGPDPVRRPEARTLAAQLDAIRSRSPDIRYVWIMRRAAAGGAAMEFVIANETFHSFEELDANRDGKLDPDEVAAQPGDPFDASRAPELQRGFEAPTADRGYDVTDQWGVALSGYAPIRNREGNAIAVLGVDIRRTDLVEHFAALDRARLIGVLSSAAFAVLGMVGLVAILVSRWLRRR
jgi:hypothetical protein